MGVQRRITHTRVEGGGMDGSKRWRCRGSVALIQAPLISLSNRGDVTREKVSCETGDGATVGEASRRGIRLLISILRSGRGP